MRTEDPVREATINVLITNQFRLNNIIIMLLSWYEELINTNYLLCTKQSYLLCTRQVCLKNYITNFIISWAGYLQILQLHFSPIQVLSLF